MTLAALIDPEQCIHGLDVGTCSICSGREARDAEATVTLRGMLREAWEQHPNEDRRLVASIVLGHVLGRPDASDLLVPALLALMVGIERGPVHQAEQRTLRSLDGLDPRPETNPSTRAMVSASPVAPSPEPGGTSVARPMPLTPPAQAVPVPAGMTLAQYTSQHWASRKQASKEWMENFVRSEVMRKTVRIGGKRMAWKDVTREQAQERLAFLERQASGTAQSITFVRYYLRLLDVTGAVTAGEYERKLSRSA